MADTLHINISEGKIGPEGKSSYQVAVQNGFPGTEEEWLQSLKGKQGPAGPQGERGEKGEQGEPGPNNIYDGLDSDATDYALSAKQGKILKDDLDTHKAETASAHGGTYHKNLLHNWDFRNPVNQRGLTSYVSNSTTGFYTIDRWMLNWNNDKVDIDSVNGNISITTVAGGRQFYQIIEKLKAGTYTFSADVISATNDWRLRYGDTTKPFITPETTGIVSVQFTISNDYENYRIGLQSVTAGSITLKCVKLELGDTSTLANDPPADYGEQLALCKRFYRLWTTEAARTEALKEVGLMRIPNPTLGTIDIGGTTYYYASADL